MLINCGRVVNLDVTRIHFVFMLCRRELKSTHGKFLNGLGIELQAENRKEIKE